jgi:UDP-glucose 4-epimerase
MTERANRVVLVTGATGFIGRRLVGALRARGVSVRALARETRRAKALWPDVTAIGEDLSNPSDLDSACRGVDTVFHLASASEGADDAHTRVTIEGTRRLLEALARTRVRRFVFFSSVKAMGEGTHGCVDESAQERPTTSYGRAKLAAEKSILEAGRRHGIHVCILRLPLVYGRDNAGSIPRMIAAIDRGRFPPLPDIANKRSMVHVDDVVQAASLALESKRASGQIYIVTDGRVYSTRELYTLICRTLARPVPPWTVPAAVLRGLAKIGDLIGRLRGRPFTFDSATLDKLLGTACYSSAKIASELGYRPTHTLIDGIEEMVREYRKRSSA